MLSLQRGDEVMAAPIYLPADPEINAPEVPALPERREQHVRNTNVYMRESHPGEAWVGVAACSGLPMILAVWIGVFALAARSHLRPVTTAAAPTGRPAPQGSPAHSGNGSAQDEDWATALHRNLARHRSAVEG